MTTLHVLTGATGLVGSALVLELAQREPESHLLCLVRAPGPGSAGQLHAMIRASADAYGLSATEADAAIARTAVVPGVDLSSEACMRARSEAIAAAAGPSVVRASGGRVHFWHSAARMYFRESERRAQFASNTAGTRRALAVAGRLGADAFTMISTAYVAGTACGHVLERPADGTLCRNPYERSKLAAERAVLAAADRLAVRVMRPSIITGHSLTHRYPGRPTGAYTAQRIVRSFHRAMPAAARTERRRVLADPDVALNLVPIDRVACEAVDIALREHTRGIFHLTDPRPPSAGDFLRACFANAGAPDPEFVQDPVRLDARDRILNTMLAVYTPYLTHRQDFDRRRTEAAIPRPRDFGPRLDAAHLKDLLAL
ncbi:thioester reductase-like protein [Kitasatospora sp. SolWspMP-SS2h]|uniref:SDR family oxidoreductase n=1 Tax=Kitasatospora sp. SolWspMP-SS2h TaxID=1305729 RepID=UPI000DB96561|nr:SDR family oxidoreductase [Kitasatospora sp. SolWspMP-SS2h]RAJ31282.1 thioester reductase-like protein [Kitasatospora sp. SolWspMP-SS2h]